LARSPHDGAETRRKKGRRTAAVRRKRAAGAFDSKSTKNPSIVSIGSNNAINNTTGGGNTDNRAKIPGWFRGSRPEYLKEVKS
jgi:hypothetical protein